MAHEVKVGARVRARLRILLAQKGLTNRAFAKRLGHGDQWVSNLLAGRFTLALDDLDEAARALDVLPSDLVRRDGEEAWILTPSEMRLLRAVRALPMLIRDHLRVMAEYLQGVAPDEIGLLTEYRKLEPSAQARIRQGIAFLRLPQNAEIAGAFPTLSAADDADLKLLTSLSAKTREQIRNVMAVSKRSEKQSAARARTGRAADPESDGPTPNGDPRPELPMKTRRRG